jgi:hypothetical protein
MPRHPPNALKTLDHSHCQYPSLSSRTSARAWGIPMHKPTSNNDRFDKKDQLLEIRPMALRLSRQSSCKGFDEHPLRRPFKSAHGPKGLARARRTIGDDLAVCMGIQTRQSFKRTRTYLLFTISYRTGSHQAKAGPAAKLHSS